jgi:hypothetical protein
VIDNCQVINNFKSLTAYGFFTNSATDTSVFTDRAGDFAGVVIFAEYKDMMADRM